MDISSTSSTAVSTSNTPQSSSAKTSKSDASFKSEMDKASTEKNVKAEDKQSVEETKQKEDNVSENKKENISENITEKNIESKIEANKTKDILNSDILLKSEIKLDDVFEQKVLDDPANILLNANKQLANIAIMTEAPLKIDYTSEVSMEYEDAQFFTELVKNPEKTLQNVVAELQNNTVPEQVTKHVKVSATLMNALADAVKTNQPFRIDFDKDVSVIIKIDRDGSFNAKFIPGDRVVEEYLKQNISTLRQRFDDEEISYRELSYSNQQQRRNRNNKENNHE